MFSNALNRLSISLFAATALGIPLLVSSGVAPVSDHGKDHGADHPVVDHVAFGHVAERHTLTLEGARTVLDAITLEAGRLGVGGGVAVVDLTGELLAFARLDGTFSAAADVSTGKARTAVRFRKPTSFFEDTINGGRIAMAGMPDFMPLRGGVPILYGGHVVGGVGVSGASSAKQDEELALIGVAALDRKP